MRIRTGRMTITRGKTGVSPPTMQGVPSRIICIGCDWTVQPLVVHKGILSDRIMLRASGVTLRFISPLLGYDPQRD